MRDKVFRHGTKNVYQLRQAKSPAHNGNLNGTAQGQLIISFRIEISHDGQHQESKIDLDS